MAFIKSSGFPGLVLVVTVLILSQAAPAAAFGAGNIGQYPSARRVVVA